MENEPFPICTTPAPRMYGRRDLLDQLIRNLTKPSPGHQSIVGPRYMGKTVLLSTLANRIREQGFYIAVIEWDLRHTTPQSDAEFRKNLCVKIGEALQQTSYADSGKELLSLTEDYQDVLGMVLDELEENDDRILMLWDGFDSLLTQGNLTRNLWDNLRELSLKPSFYLVTASRKELSALIRDEESVTSDFWNIFQTTHLKPYTEEDLLDMLSAMDGYTFPKGAMTELGNWTGCSPIFSAILLNHIRKNTEPEELATSTVVDMAHSCLSDAESFGLALWKDLEVTSQDAYRDLIHSGDVPVGSIKKSARNELVEFGLAKEERSRLIPRFRMVQAIIEGDEGEADALQRHFGQWVVYATNIPEVLKRRLSQVTSYDDRLFRFVSIALDLLEKNPESALNNLTSIEERALDVIWQRECGPDRCLDPEIISYWTEYPREQHKRVKEMMDTDNFRIPTERWNQLSVLQLLTGSHQDFDSKAKETPKDAYVLINAIHSYRNRVQHSDGEETGLGTAVAAMMTCVELLACLEPKN